MAKKKSRDSRITVEYYQVKKRKAQPDEVFCPYACEYVFKIDWLSPIQAVGQTESVHRLLSPTELPDEVLRSTAELLAQAVAYGASTQREIDNLLLSEKQSRVWRSDFEVKKVNY